MIILFDFDFSASSDKSFLVFFCFDWRNLFFDVAWSTINELLSIHKSKTCDCLNSFDDCDFGLSNSF